MALAFSLETRAQLGAVSKWSDEDLAAEVEVKLPAAIDRLILGRPPSDKGEWTPNASYKVFLL